ncbi:bifunctional diaminohydroxyphosphoribosylaminopyrimidine deaminase/5-amino-6-(5-phosphoribosylamino)uracil reductase RibD [soil metagenome]
MKASDERFMDYALRLGRRALGTTAENPPVGCVIVKDGDIVSVGWTHAGGRPHAETQALAMAGEETRDATAYVTLEPCAHHGKTPPCANALIQSGVARVVTALEDPDPRTRGKGFAILRAAGIAVETGIGAEEARRDIAGFLTRVTRGRPYVTLKLALSADGKIAAAPGKRIAITGPEVRDRVHLMRAQSDAILVGVETVRADNPELTCRLPGLESRSPIRVVLDSSLTVPRDAKLIRSAASTPVWVLSASPGTIASGVTVIACAAAADGKVDLADALRHLAGRGINRLLVEGGARIARAFLEAGLVDHLVLFTSPDTIGGQGVDAFAGLPLAKVLAGFRKYGEERLGADTLSLYEP